MPHEISSNVANFGRDVRDGRHVGLLESCEILQFFMPGCGTRLVLVEGVLTYQKHAKSINPSGPVIVEGMLEC